MDNSQFSTLNSQFGDVVADAWYADAVNWAAGSGIVSGYGDGRFGPNDAVTREQLAVMLYNYAKWKGIDVSVGESFNVSGNESTGIPVGENLNAPIDESAAIPTGESLDLSGFADFSAISAYAIPAMQWACGAGIMEGYNNNLNPKGGATRAQCAAMLMRFMEWATPEE